MAGLFRVLLVLLLVGLWSHPAMAQVTAGSPLGTRDTDDASVAADQSAEIAIALSRFYDGSVWGRWTGGTLADNTTNPSAPFVGGMSFIFDGTTWDRWTGAVSQSGTWTVQPGNTANTTAWLVTGTGGTFPVTGTFWQATQPISGTVTANAGTGTFVVGDGSGALNVICDSGCSGGTQYTEDAAAAADPVGTVVNLIRQDTPATLVSADADNVAQRGTNYGAAYVQVVSSAGALIDSFGGSGGTAQADNSTFTPDTTSMTPVGAEVDDTTPSAATEGRAAALRMSTRRELYSQIRDAAGNERGANVTAANELLVEIGAGAASIGTLGANSGVDIGDVDVTSIAAGDNNIGNVDIVTFPDNEPINVAQMNGVAVTMGNGVSGTGVQRVSLASDSTGNIATIGTSVTPGTAAGNLGKAEDAAIASADTGVAILAERNDTPTSTAGANADYITLKTNQYGFTRTTSLCQDHTLIDSAVISTASSGNVELVALAASETIYVCGWNVIAAGTVNVQLIYGTGTACATGETNLTGAYQLTTQTGVALSNGGGIQAKTASANALCIELSAGVQIDGMVTFVQGAF